MLSSIVLQIPHCSPSGYFHCLLLPKAYLFNLSIKDRNLTCIQRDDVGRVLKDVPVSGVKLAKPITVVAWTHVADDDAAVWKMLDKKLAEVSDSFESPFTHLVFACAICFGLVTMLATNRVSSSKTQCTAKTHAKMRCDNLASVPVIRNKTKFGVTDLGSTSNLLKM